MTIAVTSEADLIASIPYQLGFQPADSLVVVARHGRLVAYLARIDLPGAGAPWAWVNRSVSAALAGAPDTVTVLLYAADPVWTPVAGARVAQRLSARGVALDGLFRVHEDRWWHLGTKIGRCCGPDGHRVPPAVESPAAAEFVALGVAPLSRRADVGAILVPDRSGRDGVRRVLPAIDGGRAEAHWRGLVAGEPWAPDPEDLARLARSLEDADWRDCLIAALAPGWVPEVKLDPFLRDRARTAVPGNGVIETGELLARLARLAACTPAPLAAAPYCLLALVAFQRGHGALGNLALEAARDADDRYLLADLLHRFLAAGHFVGPLPRRAARVR